jgi:hypothetical protein
MAIVLDEHLITEKIVKAGFEEVELAAGKWVRIQHGTIQDPVVMFLEQVPQGKKWAITISVYIEETDA